ncbi:MAG: hypothetical protein E4H00_06155 [Myxococcales bacterium]|nr:MAG: hypothetical protein E4H00_06155 [Myxococcales bacterium]
MTTCQYKVRLVITVDLDEYEQCFGDKIHTSAGPGPYAAAHILEAAEERLAEIGSWATIEDEVQIALAAPHDGAEA